MLRRSLSFRLIVILSLIGLIASIAAALWSYQSMRKEGQDFIDEELSQIAAIVINYDMLIPRRWEGPRNLHERMFAKFRRNSALPEGNVQLMPSLTDFANKRFDIVIAPLIGQARDNVFIPMGIEDGFYTVLVSNERVRAFVATKATGQRFVVARPMSAISEITQRAFTNSLLQLALLAVLYIPCVIAGIHVLFKSISKVAVDLEGRTDDDLSPVAEDAKTPSELDSFICALNRMFGKIEESMASKRRFIADAAHEMRTPLTSLMLQAENLSHEDLSPKAQEKLKLLQQSIRRQKDLMNGLLNLARLQEKSPIAGKDVIVIKDLFISLIEELGILSEEKGQDLGVEGECEDCFEGDAKSVKAILTNLCSNAIKYAGEGGRIDLMAKKIIINESPCLVLTVRDDGPGIAEDDLKNVFEPFYRVGGDRQKKEGSGLGLCIAKVQAEQLGGRLELANRTDQRGLEAKLILPYVKPLLQGA